MSHHSELIESDIMAYLKDHEHKELCRFITCGSVDDGKSTLIGRLLYESKMIYEDQLTALESDSKTMGTQGEKIDFALLVDGLAAEREQGITIDVAYRYFSTSKRKFIVADTPGHEQYTRNMATGASTADIAILMIDARKGILTQTRRHSKIIQLLGVGQVVLAVNKMDLMNYDQAVFDDIVSSYHTFAAQIGISNITAIPVSALEGDNITEASLKMPWYSGPSLMMHLESTPIGLASVTQSFTMPVQWVNRPNLDFRGFSGQITTGVVRPGDAIQVLPSRQKSTVESIVTFDGDLPHASSGQSITLTLNDEIDISRGDVIVADPNKIEIASHFITTLLWMNETVLVPGKQYWVKTRAKVLNATLSAPKYALNINTLEQEKAETLGLNAIGQCELILDQDIAFEPYGKNRHLGSFIIIDKQSNNTIGMGLIESAASEKDWVDHYVANRNKYWVKGQVTAQQRQDKFGHAAKLIVLTGKANKATYEKYGTELESKLFQDNKMVYRYGFQFMANFGQVSSSDTQLDQRTEFLQALMSIAYAFLDAGHIFITSIRDLSAKDLSSLQALASPYEVDVITLDPSSDHT
ncbi:MAG: sulfate adenylyltransferase subunit CysN [bacterium]|nr:sulfate adenylyltransferase subunit CysN [bacterium]